MVALLPTVGIKELLEYKNEHSSQAARQTKHDSWEWHVTLEKRQNVTFQITLRKIVGS